MALSRDNATQQPSAQQPSNGQRGGKQQEDAVGWLNLRIKTASGEWISVKATIPMLDSNLTHRGMMNKAKASPEHKFEIEGTISIPSTVVPEF